MSLAAPPPFDASTPTDDAPPTLEAPETLVRRYLELTAQRRAVEDQLAYVRAELEMFAAPQLGDAVPRARFVAPGIGAIHARLQPTAVFDRVHVAKELQRMGRLHEVAQVQGPALARFLAKEPVAAARLGDMVRLRKSVVLMAAQG